MKRVIEFLKYRFIFTTLPIALIVVGGVFMFSTWGGFNLGIDFQPGLRQQVQIDPNTVEADTAAVREALADLPVEQIQVVGSPAEQRFAIRVPDDGTGDEFAARMPADIQSVLEEAFGSGTVTEEEVAFVGPQFSEQLTRDSVVLVGFALLLILGYVWVRFRFAYAVSSIITLLHDIAFILVVIGAFQLEVTTATIAAVLTIIGYSLNDTIVIFDRIRENETMMRNAAIPTIINTSITQSLSRTLVTSMTTLLAVAAIYVFATGQIQDFALTLMIGVVIGTYSSVFIASPALLTLQRRLEKRKRKQQIEDLPPRKQEAAVATEEGSDDGSAAEEDEAAARARAVKEELAKKRRATAGAGAGGSGKPNKPRSQRKKRR